MQPRGNRRGGGGGGGRRHDDPNVKISKNLSYLLRHGAEKEGLAMRQDGFVKLDDILAKDFYKSKKIEFAKVKEIVDTNDKKRFELKEETGEDGVKVILIRATQGHSIDKINDEELLEKIVDHTQYPNIIHGTQKDAWAFIKQTGLSKMGRNHVHFAIGYPDDGAVISGMRKSCDVYVEVDLEKCIKEGVPFFVSKNKVVLSAGVNGFIRPNYFKKVLIRTNGALKEVDPKEYEWNPQNQNVQVGGGNAGGNNNANN
jgi:2'-phosphotransferase